MEIIIKKVYKCTLILQKFDVIFISKTGSHDEAEGQGRLIKTTKLKMLARHSKSFFQTSAYLCLISWLKKQRDHIFKCLKRTTNIDWENWKHFPTGRTPSCW